MNRAKREVGITSPLQFTKSLDLSYVVSWVRLPGPVIQANRRLTFEDDLRSEGQLCFISMNASLWH